MKKKVLSIVALCTLLVGCKLTADIIFGDYQTWWVREYVVLNYDQPDVSLENGDIVTGGAEGFRILPFVRIYAFRHTEQPLSDEERLETERHIELSKQHGDTNFRGWVDRSNIDGFTRCWAYPLEIDVVSDVDYDKEHPAGTSLADVLYIKYHHYRDYIANGYKKDGGWSLDADYQVGVKEMKLISELTKEDFRLMHVGFWIYPAKTPDAIEQTLTFTLTMDGFDTPYTFSVKATYQPDNNGFWLQK